MADTNSNRLVKVSDSSPSLYLETLVYFFGANFAFHHSVFRSQGSRPQFAAFMLVNVFTSYQLAQFTNYHEMARMGAMLNNTLEMEHRANLNTIYRRRLFRQAPMF